MVGMKKKGKDYVIFHYHFTSLATHVCSDKTVVADKSDAEETTGAKRGLMVD